MISIKLKKILKPYTNVLTVLSLAFVLISIIEVIIGYKWTRVGGIQPLIDPRGHVVGALKFSAIIFFLGILYSMFKNYKTERGP